MTKYVALLEESDVADDPPTGFTRRGAASGTPASYLAAVGYGTPPFKRRQVTLTNSATDAYPAVSLDAVDADANRANMDCVVAVYRPSSNALEYVHVIVRGQGSGTVTDGYQFAIDWTNNRVRIYKIASSVRTNPFSDLTISHAAGTWALYRIRANGGATTTLTVRTWAVGVTEPTTWGLTATDSSSPVTAAGWVGLGGYAPSGTKTGIFNFLTAASNGDSAVVPLMNVDYYAWLNSPGAVRRVLAEMSAVGYDSSGSPFTKTVNAYLANGGFTTKPWDTPPDRHYDAWIVGIPTLRQEMNLALSGRAGVGFGSLVVSNTAGGARGVSRLVLDGSAGGYASAPDSAALSVTDLDIRVKLSMVDWTPAGQVTILGKFVQSGNQRSFAATVEAGGTLRLYTSSDGTNAGVISASSTVGLGLTDGVVKWLRWTLDVNDGAGNRVHRYYTSDDGITWTQLGATVTTAGTTSVFDSTAVLEVGGIDAGASQNPNATIYQAQVLSGIGGSVVASLDLSQAGKGETAFISPATGEKWTLAGTARIDNPRAISGVRDDWLRMKWNREYVKLFIGDETWPKHDFRTYLIGKCGQPVAPSMDRIEFPVADLLGILDQPLQTNAWAAPAPFEGQMKPYVAGSVSWMEPVPTSTSTLEMQVHDGPVSGIDAVYVDGISLGMSSSISAVDAGTNIMTTPSPHGMSEGFTVQFLAGTQPAPFSLFTEYFVIASGLSASGFKLSATPGGAEIDITTTPTGAVFQGYGYWVDYSGGKLTLANNPSGRVMCSARQPTALWYPADVIADVVFTKYGLSENYKDQTAFDTLEADVTESCGAVFYGEKISALDAVNKIATGVNCWYGISPDGLLQVGRLALPANTAVMDFLESDVKADSLKLTKKVPPADRPNLRVTSKPQFLLNGTLNLAPTKYYELLRQFKTDVGGAWPSAGIPLDSKPNQADVEDRPTMNSLFSSDTGGAAEVTRLETLYEKTLGVFTFETRLGALRLSIGDTISLTHPREGWKSWSIADPASPDNMTTIDSTKAVVIGKDVNLGGPNPFPVKLTVFRQIPGFYPTADVN